MPKNSGNCFGSFPPSFYYIHTEEEVRCITDATPKRLLFMVRELEKDNENMIAE